MLNFTFFKKLLKEGEMEYKSSLVYRLQFMSSILISPLIIGMVFFLWQAVYRNTGNQIMGYTFVDMITYYIITTIIGHFIYNDVGDLLQEKVIYGELNQDLLKPMSIFSQFFSRQIASRAFAFLVEVIPVFLISLFLFEIKVPSLIFIVIFSIGMIISFVINFLIGFLIGMVSFWVKKVESIQWIFFFGVRFISGDFLPLDFLGKTLLKISPFLPFFYLRYGLAQIWLQRISVFDSYLFLIKQLFWVLILYIMVKKIWDIAIKKYGAEGG